MKLIRQLLVCWLALWLPVAGAMAAAMPLSKAATVATAVALDAPSDEVTAGDEGRGAAMPCHGDATPGSAACDHCELCHIAATMLPTATPAATTCDHHLPAPALRTAPFTSHIPDLPQRPPLFLPA